MGEGGERATCCKKMKSIAEEELSFVADLQEHMLTDTPRVKQ